MEFLQRIIIGLIIISIGIYIISIVVESEFSYGDPVISTIKTKTGHILSQTERTYGVMDIFFDKIIFIVVGLFFIFVGGKIIIIRN